jgi:hypothetical protein
MHELEYSLMPFRPCRDRHASTPELIALASRFDWKLAGPPLLPTGELAGPGR